MHQYDAGARAVAFVANANGAVGIYGMEAGELEWGEPDLRRLRASIGDDSVLV